MKFQKVLVCAALALLATAANAGVVPPKAGLSPKDKLALELPVKQHLTDKAGVKTEEVKVGFSTTTSTTTTTTTTKAPKLQRPKYVDAAVFRHQFTTPSSSSSSSSTSPSISSSISDETSVAFFTRVFQTEEFLGQADRELGLVTDRKTESFRLGFRPASSGSVVLPPPSSSSTTTTTTSSTTTAPPHEDAASFDYDAHFILMDDLSPFGGELGVLGGDRRGEGYISSFRPPGF